MINNLIFQKTKNNQENVDCKRCNKLNYKKTVSQESMMHKNLFIYATMKKKNLNSNVKA